MMLLWEMLSGRRNKNKDKVRHQANTNSGEVSTTASTSNVVAVSSGAASTPPSSVAVVNNVGRHEEQGQVNVVSLRVHHNSARSESFSSPPSPHPPGSAAIVSSLFELPPAKQLPTLFRPAVGATSFANRTPDSIKLFKNSVLSRRHSTSAGLSPGLLGCPSTLGGGGVGAIAGGGANNAPQRARRRRGEDAQRYSDRRRQQHKGQNASHIQWDSFTDGSLTFDSTGRTLCPTALPLNVAIHVCVDGLQEMKHRA
ncbi:hypothetical protein OUZ56_000920 [Daphnia magna]|uniref:Uncharacterized protein n=1 Tax=Daphnia magna TaxID=35525 RepID=A0ABR0A1Q1_9CRUS|nr:hypothetical protein OUZ56_000920 [Daphnia magna]